MSFSHFSCNNHVFSRQARISLKGDVIIMLDEELQNDGKMNDGNRATIDHYSNHPLKMTGYEYPFSASITSCHFDVFC